MGTTDLVERLTDPVMDIGADGRIGYANAATCRALKRGVDEIVGQPLERFVAAEDPVSILGFRELVGDGVSDAQLILESAEGEGIVYHFNASVDSSGNIALCARNATRAQQELSEATRWAASEQERSVAERRARVELSKRNLELRRMQTELRGAFYRLKEESEKRQQLEQELRLAQKLESIGQLAAGVAHEINTPMQYIGDNLQFLERAFERIEGVVDAYRELIATLPDDPAKQTVSSVEKKARFDFLKKNVRPALEQAIEGVKKVSEIVQAMKAFSRTDSVSKEVVDVNKLIRDTLVIARSEYKSVAEVHYTESDLPPFRGFGGQLGQVILNLVVNSAHAIADQNRDQLGSIRVEARAHEDCLEIRIDDDGPGIPEEIRHRVFDPFFTTKEVGRGTGQGLSLARRIVVDKHAGTLDFTSTPGKGTTFTIALPLSSEDT